MAPGIMMTILYTVTLGLTALMFVIEKKEGLHERGFVSGVTTLEIMMGHVAVKFMIMIVQIVLMMIITIFAFDVRFKLIFLKFQIRIPSFFFNFLNQMPIRYQMQPINIFDHFFVLKKRI